MNVKNKIPQEKKTGVVYEVPCQECSQGYIGETRRALQKRLAEHRQAVKRSDDKNGITIHTYIHKHQIDWDGAKVVEEEGYYWNRRVLEAIRIQSKTDNHESGLWLEPQ